MQQWKQSLTSMQQKRPALDERPASPDHSVSSTLGTHGTHACSVLASDTTHTRLYSCNCLCQTGDTVDSAAFPCLCLYPCPCLCQTGDTADSDAFPLPLSLPLSLPLLTRSISIGAGPPPELALMP